MNALNITTTTFDMGDGFRSDVVQFWCNEDDSIPTVEAFEAWIYHDDYGKKSFMFGCTNTKGFSDFVDMVERNFTDYKKMYQDEVMSYHDK